MRVGGSDFGCWANVSSLPLSRDSRGHDGKIEEVGKSTDVAFESSVIREDLQHALINFCATRGRVNVSSGTGLPGLSRTNGR